MPVRTNVTNRQQDQLESATYDSNIPVHAGDGNLRLVSSKSGGSERTANDGAVTNTKRNGVVYSHDDKFGTIPSDTIGRA